MLHCPEADLRCWVCVGGGRVLVEARQMVTAIRVLTHQQHLHWLLCFHATVVNQAKKTWFLTENVWTRQPVFLMLASRLFVSTGAPPKPREPGLSEFI